MRPRLVTAVCSAFLSLALSATALADFEVAWQQPVDANEALFADALRASGMVADAAALERVPLDWPSDLTLVFGGSGTPNFQREAATITLPYSYLAQAVQAQSQFELERSAALQRGLDTVEFTLYHLLAQALTDPADTERDADLDKLAEHTATWLMVSQFPNGAEQWFVNTEAFARASQRLDGPLTDYWHSHSVYAAREREINCLIVGSDLSLIATLFRGLDAETAQACAEDWQELNRQFRN